MGCMAGIEATLQEVVVLSHMIFSHPVRSGCDYNDDEIDDEDDDDQDAGGDEDFSMSLVHKSASWVPTGGPLPSPPIELSAPRSGC